MLEESFIIARRLQEPLSRSERDLETASSCGQCVLPERFGAKCHGEHPTWDLLALINDVVGTAATLRDETNFHRWHTTRGRGDVFTSSRTQNAPELSQADAPSWTGSRFARICGCAVLHPLTWATFMGVGGSNLKGKTERTDMAMSKLEHARLSSRSSMLPKDGRITPRRLSLGHWVSFLVGARGFRVCGPASV